MWEKWEVKHKNRLFTPRICSVLDKCPVSVDKKHVQMLLKRQRWGYICGEPATGKTIYAAALLLECLKQTYDRTYYNVQLWGMFESLYDMIHEGRMAVGESSNYNRDVVKKYGCADILVIDDFVIEKLTPWMSEFLYGIINTRYEYLRPTIFTSNIKPENLAEMIQDDRLVSRIIGKSDIVEFKGVFND